MSSFALYIKVMSYQSAPELKCLQITHVPACRCYCITGRHMSGKAARRQANSGTQLVRCIFLDSKIIFLVPFKKSTNPCNFQLDKQCPYLITLWLLGLTVIN